MSRSSGSSWIWLPTSVACDAKQKIARWHRPGTRCAAGDADHKGIVFYRVRNFRIKNAKKSLTCQKWISSVCSIFYFVSLSLGPSSVCAKKKNKFKLKKINKRSCEFVCMWMCMFWVCHNPGPRYLCLMCACAPWIEYELILEENNQKKKNENVYARELPAVLHNT